MSIHSASRAPTSCLVALAVGLLGAPFAFAGDVGALVQFQAGTTARASEVNQNFDDLRTGVNSKLDRDTIGSCQPGSSIRSIAANGSVTCETDDVGAGGGGDITSVTAGAGLMGGGDSGDVTLSLGTDAVTSAQIQNNTIVDADVSPTAAIAVGKIAGDAGFEVGGFFSNASLSTSITSLGSIQVTAPGPGQVIVFMSGSSLLQHNSIVEYGIGLNGTTFSSSHKAGAVGATGNITTFFPINIVLGVSVGSAQTLTLHALARKGAISENDVGVSQVNLVAVFVPKRY